MVGQICVCVCVCLWGLTEAGRLRWNWWIRLAELSDRNITIKPSAQCLPLPALFLSLINTGIGLQFGQVPGQQGRTAQPFSPHRTRITQQNSSKKHLLLTLTHNGLSVCVCGSGFAWTKCPHKDTKPVITYIVKTSERSLSVYLSVCLSICLSVCLSMRKMAYIQKKVLRM